MDVNFFYDKQLKINHGRFHLLNVPSCPIAVKILFFMFFPSWQQQAEQVLKQKILFSCMQEEANYMASCIEFESKWKQQLYNILELRLKAHLIMVTNTF